MISVETRLSATQAARRFSDLLNRVVYRGERFLIERGGRTICRIEPAAPATCSLDELVRLLETAPKPDEGFWEDVAEIQSSQPSAEESRW